MERHPFSWIRKINIVRMVLLCKLIYIFNTIQMKILADFFVDIDKLVLKFIRKFKGTMPKKS